MVAVSLFNLVLALDMKHVNRWQALYLLIVGFILHYVLLYTRLTKHVFKSDVAFGCL